LNESFFWPEFETKTKARDAILKWIKWNNTERLHSSLGYMTPIFGISPDMIMLINRCQAFGVHCRSLRGARAEMNSYKRK
jgi:hypothetical protein